jgi:hypothetical protein
MAADSAIPLAPYLNIVDDFLLENLPLLENLLHGHTGNNDTGLSLNDALDDVLNMIALGRHYCSTSTGRTGAIRIARQEKCIFLQGIQVIVRTNGKDSRQSKLELLHCHCLKVQGEIEWRDGDSCAFLPWFDKCLLDNPDIFNSGAGDDEVFIWLGNTIPHGSRHFE